MLRGIRHCWLWVRRVKDMGSVIILAWWIVKIGAWWWTFVRGEFDRRHYRYSHQYSKSYCSVTADVIAVKIISFYIICYQFSYLKSNWSNLVRNMDLENSWKRFVCSTPSSGEQIKHRWGANINISDPVLWEPIGNEEPVISDAGSVSISGYHYNVIHDDAIKWKHFPRYWPFVRGIHRSPVNSPHKG